MAAMHRVLAVEDDHALREDLVYFLSACGFAAAGAASIEATREALAAAPPDIVLLDIRLPDGSGFELAREIRATLGLGCGIVMLTGLSAAGDRVQGLDCGADAYLIKHASLAEIEATIRSLLRRMGAPGQAAAAPEIGAAAWQLDRADWRLVSPEGRGVRLTGTEFALLETLAAGSGKPRTRTELIDALQRPAMRQDERNLDTAVRRLRRKIATGCGIEPPIRMIYGLGYAFTGMIRPT